MSEKYYKLFSDGACRGNPASGRGGCITDDADHVIWEGKEYLGHCTNNIAEYKALILGLKGALSQGYRTFKYFWIRSFWPNKSTAPTVSRMKICRHS
jgi:ribonuclease HI